MPERLDLSKYVLVPDGGATPTAVPGVEPSRMRHALGALSMVAGLPLMGVGGVLYWHALGNGFLLSALAFTVMFVGPLVSIGLGMWVKENAEERVKLRVSGPMQGLVTQALTLSRQSRALGERLGTPEVALAADALSADVARAMHAEAEFLASARAANIRQVRPGTPNHDSWVELLTDVENAVLDFAALHASARALERERRTPTVVLVPPVPAPDEVVPLARVTMDSADRARDLTDQLTAVKDAHRELKEPTRRLPSTENGAH